MRQREDALSTELYITLAVMAGIIGVVLVALAVFPEVDLGMRALRLLTGGLLLYGCYLAAREAIPRLEARRALPLGRSEPGPLQGRILELLRAGRRVAAIRLYRDVMGVGLMDARRQVERIARQARSGRRT